METGFYTFGEILWDCLPSGRHAGGAPFNVASHLAQLGVAASLISAVGRDPLGDEILQVAAEKSVDTRWVSRASTGLPTGTVIATLDAAGSATYEIVQPVAWDEISVPAGAVAAVEQSDALVFGSLACRSPHNLEQLRLLLALRGPLKFFDVNLRPPFVDLPRVIDLGSQADVIKLNHEEAGLLAAWLRHGKTTGSEPVTADTVAAAGAALADATGARRVCVTLGAAGAALWDRGQILLTPAPAVVVKDTVGAGDAFMAALAIGLVRGAETRSVLAAACRLGAYVASCAGATPLLPRGLREELGRALRLA
jgi:fructokinase